MASKSEIKEQLDKYYDEYQKSGELNKTKSTEVITILERYYFCNNVNSDDIALELARFSKGICNSFCNYSLP